MGASTSTESPEGYSPNQNVDHPERGEQNQDEHTVDIPTNNVDNDNNPNENDFDYDNVSTLTGQTNSTDKTSKDDGKSAHDTGEILMQWDSGDDEIEPFHSPDDNKSKHDTQFSDSENSVVDPEQELQEEEYYPPEFEQSDAFTRLYYTETLQNVVSRRAKSSFEFILRETNTFDRYVRLTMRTLLTWLGTVRTKSQNPADLGATIKTTLTMKDLSFYVEYLPQQYRQQFALRVERVLNSNGLSLGMKSKQRFDPDELARLFVVVHEPTVKRCFCHGQCNLHEEITNPTHVHYCDCTRAMRFSASATNKIRVGRKCTDACKCDPNNCDQRDFVDEIQSFAVLL